jgi:integrase
MVYKQPKSKYWWYKFTWNGELIRKSTKQTNKRVAEQMEAAHRTALAKEEVGIREKKRVPTLEEFGPKFMNAIATECADKPATVSFYRSKLSYLERSRLAKIRIDQIDEVAIDGYKQVRANQESRRGKLLSIGSINRELATLRRLLRLAYAWKLLDRLPKIRLLRGEKGREFVLTHEQEARYLDASSNGLRDLAIFLLDTGLRMRECLTLEWSEVHLTPVGAAKYGYLTVRSGKAKNSKSRNVPLTSRVVEVLKRNGPAPTGLVFHRDDGQPLYQTWLNQQHAAVHEELELPAEFVPHSFRHTYGTRLGESGADAFTIMKLMGHSSVTVSQRYVHPSPQFVEVAIERFESLNERQRESVGILSGIPSHGDSPCAK